MTNEPAALLREGRAFADLSSWRKIAVTGSDAMAWLQDLVSADLDGMRAGDARRSLLLSPTGRVRAEFTVAVTDEGMVLVQDPTQPRSILDLLSPYTLSSDVQLEDRTAHFSLFALPGANDAPNVRATLVRPSALGTGTGLDLIAPIDQRDRIRDALTRELAEAGLEDVEIWRIAAGLPRFGMDALEEDLPQEAGLAGAVSFGKGCYLGQEAVAKVRNLGHPRRLVLALVAGATVSPGDDVVRGGGTVGQLTSAAELDGSSFAIGRVSWDGREGPFETSLGVALLPREEVVA